MKKILAILLAALFCVSVTSCAAKPNSPTSNTDSVSTDAGNEPTGEKQKITAWAWDQKFNIAALKEAEKIYEAENPNVDIEIVEFAQNDTIQKMNTSLSSGTTSGLPNIILIEDYRIQTFLKAYPNSFKDLTGIIKHNDYSSYKLDFMTIDGKTYGVPFDTGSAVLYYRKDIIEQAGYTEADMADLTWEKYVEIGKAVKEKTGKYMLTLDPNDVGQLRIMMQSAGTWYVKEDGTTPNLQNNVALNEGMKIYKQMVDAGIAKSISEWAQFVAGPNSGEVATVPTGCWFTPSIMAEASQSGQWKIAPIPKLGAIKESVNASNLGGSSWYVLNDVKGADVAADFLAKTFGSNNSFYEAILKNNGIISTYLPAAKTDAYNIAVDYFGGQKIYSDISNWAAKIPSVNYGLHTYAFEDIIKAEMQNVMAGTKIEDALANAQKQAEAQIQ